VRGDLVGLLPDKSVTRPVIDGTGHAGVAEIALRCERHEVQAAEPAADRRISLAGVLELNGDIALPAGHVAALHVAVENDIDFGVCILEVDQPRHQPVCAKTFGYRDAHAVPGAGGRLFLLQKLTGAAHLASYVQEPIAR